MIQVDRDEGRSSATAFRLLHENDAGDINFIRSVGKKKPLHQVIVLLGKRALRLSEITKAGRLKLSNNNNREV